MSKKSFDKFAYKGSIYDLEIIDNYAKENNNRIGKYKNNIFCPECKKARLKYVPKPAPRWEYNSDDVLWFGEWKVEVDHNI